MALQKFQLNAPQIQQMGDGGRGALLSTLGTVAGAAVGGPAGAAIGGAVGGALGGQNAQTIGMNALTSEYGKEQIGDAAKGVKGFFSSGEGALEGAVDSVKPTLATDPFQDANLPGMQQDPTQFIDQTDAFNGQSMYASVGKYVSPLAAFASAGGDKQKKVLKMMSPLAALTLSEGGDVPAQVDYNTPNKLAEGFQCGPLASIEYKKGGGKVGESYKMNYHNPLMGNKGGL